VQLVAKGFSQIEGLDYNQVFSPVVCFKTVCLILVIAALENWTIQGLDMQNTYLYRKLDKEIYMEQPEGYKIPGKEHMVFHLLCALYGLKQAGLAWWQALKASMEDMGFICLNSDAGIFLYRNKESFVITVIYVDDSLFCGPLTVLVKQLKEKFQAIWETQDLGEVMEFLCIGINCVDHCIHIDQTVYLQTVLQHCGMQNSKSALTPLPAGYVPTKWEGVTSPEL